MERNGSASMVGGGRHARPVVGHPSACITGRWLDARIAVGLVSANTAGGRPTAVTAAVYPSAYTTEGLHSVLSVVAGYSVRITW